MTTRDRFERLITREPHDLGIERYGPSSETWAGRYKDYRTQIAWEMFAVGVTEARMECAKVVDDREKTRPESEFNVVEAHEAEAIGRSIKRLPRCG